MMHSLGVILMMRVIPIMSIILYKITQINHSYFHSNPLGKRPK
jgi:hypothetical protein